MYSDLYNNTVREFFSHQRMEDCHLEIFSMCQEGMISINEMKIDFDNGKPGILHVVCMIIRALHSQTLIYKKKTLFGLGSWAIIYGIAKLANTCISQI